MSQALVCLTGAGVGKMWEEKWSHIHGWTHLMNKKQWQGEPVSLVAVAKEQYKVQHDWSGHEQCTKLKGKAHFASCECPQTWIGCNPWQASGRGNEMWNTMAAARSETSGSSLNASISSFIQLVESYYCAVNTSLNISEVSIADFFPKLWSIKKICLGFQIVNNVWFYSLFLGGGWASVILQGFRVLVPLSAFSVSPSFLPSCNLLQTLFPLSSGSEELKRMAHSKARVTDGKVTYPPGVKEISDKISKEEMVRRLKVSVFLPLCCSRVSSIYCVVTQIRGESTGFLI